LQFGAGQAASNIESSVVGTSATSAEPVVAPTPAIASNPPVIAAPVPPVVSSPLGNDASSASASSSGSDSAPASTPVVTPVVAPAGPIVPVTQPIVVTDQQLTGFTTEHRGPDGSLITVTSFKGQLPPNSFQATQLFNPFGHPLFAGSPLNSVWTGSGSQVIRGKRASTVENVGKSPSAIAMKARKTLKEHPRVSESFHYPSPPPDYFTTYKRPFVPVVDNEFSDLI